MQLIEKDGVTLAYEDINAGLPPMLLVHGWGCDHASLDAQAEFFGNSHRVVSVDLRGHGKSDGPVQDYTMAAFADDLAWRCEKLRLIKPIVIGHSMGGSIILELAASYPDVPASIVLLNPSTRRQCSSNGRNCKRATLCLSAWPTTDSTCRWQPDQPDSRYVWRRDYVTGYV
jgi:pimeloyl-ACP methyl ester carboxylesterase